MSGQGNYTMDGTQYMMDNMHFFFVVKHTLPNGKSRLELSGYAPYPPDCTVMPFDTETDAALYFLREYRNGAVASEEHVETAHAILRGEQPMFVYEEKQPDGSLWLSFHDALPPEGSQAIAFGSRSSKRLARFLLRRLHEGNHIHASAETIKRAQELAG